MKALIFSLALVLLAPGWAEAVEPVRPIWPLLAERLLAADAASFSPPDLKRQIVKHRDRLMAGVADAIAADDGSRDPSAHRAAAVRTARLIARRIREQEPFAGVVYELGGVVHELAAASVPPAAALPERSSFAGYPSDPFRAPELLIVSARGPGVQDTYDAALSSATRLFTWIWKAAGGECSIVKSLPESKGPFVIRE